MIDDHRLRASVAAPGRYFYFHMALACMAVAFLGFAATYWLPLASGSFASTPVVHFHGLLFFTWTLYFAFQTWLAASGRIARHRAMGMIGVSLATAMTILGFLVAVHSMKHSAELGQPDAGIAFAIVPLSGILFFAVVFALAVASTRRPETHKRLAPPGPPGPPPVPVTIAPALVACLLLVVAIVADWRTRGRPHPVYIYGGAALVAVKLLNWPISMTPAWHSLAGGILALAQ
jgi:hypothetical protein